MHQIPLMGEMVPGSLDGIRDGEVVQRMPFSTGRPGSNASFTTTSCITSLSLSFRICKVEIVIIPS